jgi:NAD(P)-dependent dehydrogenase (short-subunit alcohol dehydrogenase family)
MYNASKAATNLISDNLRLELVLFDIQVITVSPVRRSKAHFLLT